jgi:hypothetical protein
LEDVLLRLGIINDQGEDSFDFEKCIKIFSVFTAVVATKDPYSGMFLRSSICDYSFDFMKHSITEHTLWIQEVLGFEDWTDAFSKAKANDMRAARAAAKTKAQAKAKAAAKAKPKAKVKTKRRRPEQVGLATFAEGVPGDEAAEEALEDPDDEAVDLGDVAAVDEAVEETFEGSDDVGDVAAVKGEEEFEDPFAEFEDPVAADVVADVAPIARPRIVVKIRQIYRLSPAGKPVLTDRDPIHKIEVFPTETAKAAVDILFAALNIPEGTTCHNFFTLEFGTGSYKPDRIMDLTMPVGQLPSFDLSIARKAG